VQSVSETKSGTPYMQCKHLSIYHAEVMMMMHSAIDVSQSLPGLWATTG